jgi:hypothetical protein
LYVGPKGSKSPRQEPSSDSLPFGGLFDEIELQMTSSNFRRGSKIRTPKSRTSPNDLAEQFLELQRLRKKVYELEKRFSDEIQRGRGDNQTPARKLK